MSTLRVSEYQARFSALLEILSPEEKQRARRFLRDEDRQRFILGRAATRLTSARYAGVAPKDVTFTVGISGKPGLRDGRSPFEFNVAHSGDFVLLAWSEHSPVGIDVESVHRIASFTELAASFFSPEERQVLSEPGGDIASLFYRIWARKEAILKAEGCGIAGGLQSFTVASLSDEWPCKVTYPATNRAWQLTDFEPAPNYVAALAVLEGTRVEHCAHADLETLIP